MLVEFGGNLIKMMNKKIVILNLTINDGKRDITPFYFFSFNCVDKRIPIMRHAVLLDNIQFKLVLITKHYQI